MNNRLEELQAELLEIKAEISALIKNERAKGKTSQNHSSAEINRLNQRQRNLLININQEKQKIHAG